MNEKTLRSFLKNLIEQKAPTAEINLWPAIESRLSGVHVQTSKLTATRGNKMKTRQPFARWAAVIAATAFLFAGVFFLTGTPRGQVIAQTVLGFFTRADSNRMPGAIETGQTWVKQTPGVAAATATPKPTPQGPAFETTCGSFQSPRCTVEDIRELVSFPVIAMVDRLDGFDFVGATGGPEGVVLFYASQTQGDWLTINQSPAAGDQFPAAWNVGAEADIQSVMIGSAAGDYVKGSYDGNHNPPVWNVEMDVQTLRWISQRVAISLQVIGEGSRIDQQGMVALAESLSDGSTAPSARLEACTVTPTPKPFDFNPAYPLTLSEAEQQAGFTVLSPSRLPEALSFAGAKYDKKAKSVELFYRYNRPNMPELTDGLLMQEMLIPDDAPCSLCGFDIGQYDGRPENAGRWVGENAVIETMEMDGITLYYVEGTWKGTDCCGWVWEPDPYLKQLRWQANGMAFELSYMGTEIEKEDLIFIANSLQ